MFRISQNMVVLSCLFSTLFFLGVTGCTKQPGLQYGLRGTPNSPYQQIQTLRVDQNAMYNMTSVQFDEYKRRLDWANSYQGQVIQNDIQAANAAKSWINEQDSYYRGGGSVNQIANDLSRTLSRELSSELSNAVREIFD